MEDANPHADKRPRVEHGSSSDPARDQERGKGVAKRVKEYAAQPLAALTEELTQHGVALRKGIKSATKAAEALAASKEKGEVVTSLRLIRSPALESIFKDNEELTEGAAKLEAQAQDNALRNRQKEAADKEKELSDLMEGDTFLKAARSKLRPERIGGLAGFMLDEHIKTAAEDFKLCLYLKFVTFENTEAAQAEAAKKRAEQKEKERMEIEQQDTATTVKRLVDEQVRKALAKLQPPPKPPPAKVSFQPAGSTPSRGRSPKRAQTPHPGKGRGKRKPKGGGKAQPPAKPRGRSSSRGSHRASRSRSKSQGNGNGDRGAHPHRPPSGKQGGSGRAGGGGGSKTGPRR